MSPHNNRIVLVIRWPNYLAYLRCCQLFLRKETEATAFVCAHSGYDGFNRILNYWDSRNYLWQQVFNHSDRIIKMTKPSGKSTNHLYNEQAILLRQTSAEGNIYCYDYSPKVDMLRRRASTG